MAAKFKACSVDNCKGNAHYTAGGKKDLCGKHYQRLWKTGDPLGGDTEKGEPMRFILEVVMTYDGDECLKWPFAENGHGRGQLRVGGENLQAHRYVCTLSNGEPPTPLHEAAHSCGNGDKGCITKGHLSWKTRVENEADKLIHGTHNRGERHPLAKLSEDDARYILASKGIISQKALANQFDINESTVRGIQRGRGWAWLSPE